MSKKNKPGKHKQILPVKNLNKKSTLQWIIPFILLVTFLAYIPVLKAGFVNWDDGDYVTENLLIRSFANIKLLFTTPVQGNYHPLTMISLAFNYAISGSQAWSYHLLNLLLHLVNCILVFRLALLLSNRNIIIAFTASILFGIHPMHIESVAWVSERKDVLYGLFFLAGLISYTKFADAGLKKHYWLTLVFFILSLLSKPAAIIFPLVLFCIDLLRKRKFNLRSVSEKVPFFILSVLLGVLTLSAQKTAGAAGVEAFGMGTKILFGFYGLMMYFIKMILPLNLSPFYPLPALNEKLSIAFYLAPLFSVALLVLFIYSLKKIRSIAFGTLFYVVNLLLVLQVFTVGSAIIAERYTYIPYIGLFYAAGWMIDRYAKSNLSKSYIIILPVTLLFSIATFRQASVWQDGVSLWEHAIKTNPSSRAYTNRANLLKKENNQSLAIEYYNRAIGLNAQDNEAYTNRGNIYFEQDKLDLAYNDYSKALSINPRFHPALDNMGAQFAKRDQLDSALFYLDKALSVKKDYKPAYLNRGVAYMKLDSNEKAILDFEKYLEFAPDADVSNSIGVCYQKMRKYQESIRHFSKAIEIGTNPVFYLNRSYSYFALQNMEQAKKDALMAKQNGIQISSEYAASIGIQ